MSDRPDRPGVESAPGLAAGGWAALGSALVLLAIAFSIDLPRMSGGFKGDEATYYMLAHSLARDGDFEYRRADFQRVWREYAGPQGVFLKRGQSVRTRFSAGFPFVVLEKTPDADRGRLYYSKAFIYPLVAAPFVWLFGTTGFLVLHALLLSACLGAAVSLLCIRGVPAGPAVLFAVAFLGASVIPVYFFWITPEIFNLSVAGLAGWLWAYKEAAAGGPGGRGRLARFLASDASTWAAALLIGVLIYSKPTHVVLLLPVAGLAMLRRRWKQATVSLGVAVAAAGSLFLINLALTGDANYQGGDRRTFYSQPGGVPTAGFPFAATGDTFDVTGSGHATDTVPVAVLVRDSTLTVFRHNVWYFLVGRYGGLVPYGFPGIVCVLLFLAAPRGRPAWQWLALASSLAMAVLLLIYMPNTFSGGGGPIGNRYYLSMYPWLLLLVPPFRRSVVPLAAAVGGLLFVGPIVVSPIAAAGTSGYYANTGPLRSLPIELTTLNDLPVAARADRARLAIGGDPPTRAYFPDDNAFSVEDGGFWIRGAARADVILRAPARTRDDGRVESLRIAYLDVELQNGGAANSVSVDAGAEEKTVSLAPLETGRLRVAMPDGVPYQPWTFPVNYTYVVSISSAAGFVPALQSPDSADARLLGAFVRLAPVYQVAR